MRLIDACNRAGIGVPEEVAVVGCENEETLCGFSSPTLTSVQFDGREVGYQAAKLLDQMMAGSVPKADSLLVPPKGIVIRESSDEWVIEDPLVLRAVQLIRAHAMREDFQINELVGTVGVSHSTLERRMRKVLRRGPKEEVMRVRFREVNRLLMQTDFTIERIAELTGFRHAHYLQAIYKKRFGKTPGSVRTAGGG